MTKQSIFRILFVALVPLFAFNQENFAQSQLDQKINIHLENATLEETLIEIASKSDIEFAYNQKLIKNTGKLNPDFKNVTVKEILDSLFQDLEIGYVQRGQQIILKKKPKKQNNQVTTYTLSGTLTEKATGEFLIGVNIYFPSLNTGTVTNEYGYYSMSLPLGKYKVEFSYTGFQKTIRETDLKQNQLLNIDLQFDESLLSEVTITPEDDFKDLRFAGLGKVNISPYTVQKVPNVFGEPDVVKTLQMLPGVTSLYEGASSFYVRGGNRDQNLVLVDDAPVYNPSHFFGLLSAFDQYALKDIQVYKSGIPARFGGRLSSVVDIRMNDGDLEKFKVSGGVGLISARLTAEGPLKKNKSSFMFSARRSLLDIYLNNTSAGQFNTLIFYDISTKLNVKINKNNRVFFSLYAGKDVFNENDKSDFGGITWFNTASSLRWNHIFNSRLFLNTTLLYSTYNYYLGNPSGNKQVWHSHITDIGIKADFSYFANPSNTVRFGYQVINHEINPGRLERKGEIEPAYYIPERYATEHGFYGGNNKKISDKFSLYYGFRIPVFYNTGKSTIYLLDENYVVADTLRFNKGQTFDTKAGFEPRLVFRYFPNKKNAFSLSYERQYQFLQLVTNLTGSLTSVEVWLPAGPNIKPQVSDQVSAGYFTNVLKGRVKLSTEVYYKYMKNLVDYRDHALLFLNPQIESQLRFGKGRAYGLEISFRKETGKLTGMMGYSLSKTEKQIDDVNNNRVYPANYDRPHEFSVFLSYKISRHWGLATNWTYATGNPTTSPSGFILIEGKYVPIYNERNNSRFPDYHRLDISASLGSDPAKNKRFQHQLTLGIYNLYGRKNPISFNFNKIEDGNGNLNISNDQLDMREIFPAQTYLFNVVPTLTYNFKF